MFALGLKVRGLSYIWPHCLGKLHRFAALRCSSAPLSPGRDDVPLSGAVNRTALVHNGQGWLAVIELERLGEPAVRPQLGKSFALILFDQAFL